ncbi:hypothetical protein RND81_14G068200 [Saponaria officinalis]|uniref:Uncharacterized protein n=1 Tax=Saponaria officinalis TaxID=3572 RepID=A0AAW1GR50_SAPOF
MSSLFSLLLFSLLFSLSFSLPPYSFHINCGGSSEITSEGQQWLPDTDFVSSGTKKPVNMSWVIPVLSTVRSFPKNGNLNKKFCYEIGPVIRSAKYMVRTTYFYGGVNGASYKNPPVFDQIVDGALWGMVNTTDDYGRNMSSYYEGVFQPLGKSMSVCVAINEFTDSDPFISAIELEVLGDSVYNSTDFGKFALSLVARNNFGYQGPMIRSPDDQFDRFWQPFGLSGPITGVSNVSVSGIWNLPPAKIFETRLTVDKGPMELQWPEGSLPRSEYYIALYFADDRASSHREFSISINDVPFISNLNVTSSGVAVFSTKWPLDGVTNLKFTPAAGSDSGPLVNGGEIFDILSVGKKTLVRDAIALESIKKSLHNPPEDWNGDPCFPAKYTWTGIKCSNGTRIRIISINLDSMGVAGTLSPDIAKLTALNTIVLRRNNFYGKIPSSLGKLKHLEILDLGNNHFDGTIPSSLGEIQSLRELHLENNNLRGTIPKSLIQKPGLNSTFSPGNRLSLLSGRKL